MPKLGENRTSNEVCKKGRKHQGVSTMQEQKWIRKIGTKFHKRRTSRQNVTN